MKDKTAPLHPDNIYHIYNRANGNERLFLSDENYLFFLQKYVQHINSIVDTLCYCLMPNHFHFLVRIKSEPELKKVFGEQIKSKSGDGTNPQGFKNLEGLISNGDANLTGFENLSGLITKLLSKEFSNLFNAYTKAFNKQNNRKGGLFIRPYKRKQVKDEAYLRKLIHYIHYNPIEAALTDDYNWKYSSYPAIVSKQKTKIARQEVIGYFHDLDNFIYCHKNPPHKDILGF